VVGVAMRGLKQKVKKNKGGSYLKEKKSAPMTHLKLEPNGYFFKRHRGRF
jgi:hypothetical protein